MGLFRSHRHLGKVVDTQVIKTYGEDWYTGKTNKLPFKTETKVTARCDECKQLFQVFLSGDMAVPKDLEISK